MHYAQLRTQSFDVVLNVRLQRIKIQTVLVQGMQDFLFVGVVRDLGVLFRLLVVTFESSHEFPQIFGCQVSHGVQRRRLKVLKAGMVEDLAD